MKTDTYINKLNCLLKLWLINLKIAGILKVFLIFTIKFYNRYFVISHDDYCFIFTYCERPPVRIEKRCDIDELQIPFVIIS